MSVARSKGTRGENYFLPVLRKLFYPNLPATDLLEDGSRHPLQRLDMEARHDRATEGDYVGVPWLHEAKHTAKPLFQAWARICKAKAGLDWVLLWKGDSRTADGQPLVVMPLQKYVDLVRGQAF